MAEEKAASLPRFDGEAVWEALTPAQQAEIGAIALELIVAQIGEDAYYDKPEGGAGWLEIKPEGRPFVAVQPLLNDMLLNAIQDALRGHVPALDDDTLPVPIPSLLGPVCRVCRCSQDDPCEEGCGWAEIDLCTACIGKVA